MLHALVPSHVTISSDTSRHDLPPCYVLDIFLRLEIGQKDSRKVRERSHAYLARESSAERRRACSTITVSTIGTTDYLLDNASGVMNYVLRGRRFEKADLQGLRSKYAYALLQDAARGMTDAQALEFADLNTEYALRSEKRPDVSFPALGWLADRRKMRLPNSHMPAQGASVKQAAYLSAREKIEAAQV